MDYNNIMAVLFEMIPEVKEEYNKRKQEDLVDEDTGKHMVFGLVIVPYILGEVNSDGENIGKIFDFLEEMSLCDDVKVRELLDFTILEQFIDEGKEQLNKLKKFMHENTLSCCAEIEKYFIDRRVWLE